MTDEDKSPENRDHRFSLKGPGSDLFVIGAKTPDIRVKVPGSIDCEKAKIYHLMVRSEIRGSHLPFKKPLKQS